MYPARSAEGSGTGAGYPPFPEGIPPRSAEQGKFRARFATTENQLDDVLRLRFRIFNVELAEGLERSWVTGRDEDQFDRTCHHLLVEESQTGQIVGTYRLQTSDMARRGQGFYTAGEFDLEQLPAEVLADAIEIGRACIDADYRNRHVLFLLWKGLAQYLMHSGKRYFFGCCSLTSQDPVEGWKLYRQLQTEGAVHPRYHVPALPGLACAEPAATAAAPEVAVPTLFRAYLRYGALVCSPPAIDREFKTIDYLVLFDRATLDQRTRSIFFD